MSMPRPTDAHEWLRLLESSHLSPPTQLLVDEIEHTITTQSSERAKQLVDRLLILRDALTDRMEKAETTLESGLALYQLGDCEHAIQRLEEARELYRNNLHYTTVALWMSGCIQWELLAEHDKAYTAWSQCIAQFTILQKSSGNASHARWYAGRIEQINADIVSALKQERQAPPPTEPGAAKPPGPETPPEAAPVEEPAPVDPQVLLQLFRVVEEIPAGGFGPVGFRPYTIGEVQTSQVIIQGEPYRMANLHGSGKVIALRSSSYVVLKVTGDSMNKPGKLGEEGIDSGDFVLLHLQETANDGDIVAAEIDDLDSQATLKRLRIIQEGRQYILEPQSTNPIHQPRTFSQMNEGFRIRGSVLVIFKPVHKHPSS
jgi:tetratricopeptide (TPR) repeat protein